MNSAGLRIAADCGAEVMVWEIDGGEEQGGVADVAAASRQ